MTDKAKELAKQVLDTQEGITPEQLKALIEAEQGKAPAAQPTPQAAAEPASAPAPQAPVGQPAAPAEPTLGQPNFLDLIPEKFREKDVPTSLGKITKSYSELEAELKKQKDEAANLNKLVQSFMAKEPTYAPTPVAPPMVPAPGGEEVDDASFFERPTDSVKKIAAQMAAAQIIAYHVQQERQKYVEAFKLQQPDFDRYREDMLAVLKARPDLDRDERNLPLVYELAKQRYAARLNAMRTDLGIQSQLPPQQPQAQQPNVDVEAVTKAAYLKARDDILAEIEARRRASGIQGAAPAVSPESRVQPRVMEKEASPEDQIIQEMLNSGPRKLTLGE